MGYGISVLVSVLWVSHLNRGKSFQIPVLDALIFLVDTLLHQYHLSLWGLFAVLSYSVCAYPKREADHDQDLERHALGGGDDFSQIKWQAVLASGEWLATEALRVRRAKSQDWRGMNFGDQDDHTFQVVSPCCGQFCGFQIGTRWDCTRRHFLHK